MRMLSLPSSNFIFLLPKLFDVFVIFKHALTFPFRNEMRKEWKRKKVIYQTGKPAKVTISELNFLKKKSNTHDTASKEDDEEALDRAGRADDPGHTDEEDDAEDVLDARQVDAHQGPEIGLLRGLGVGVGGPGLNGGRVVGQRADDRGHLRSLRYVILMVEKKGMNYKDFSFIIPRNVKSVTSWYSFPMSTPVSSSLSTSRNEGNEVHSMKCV